MTLYRFEEHTPQVASSAWVAPGAHVMGQVVLEDEANIWFGAVLRGDNEPIVVGRGSNVQENSVFHTDPGCPLTIGADVTVGHMAILHGCTIEDGALIGMGATVMNRAVIGAGSLIGAGALVPEGKVIPPRSLVLGSPGKVVRELDEAASRALLKSAEGYRAKAARFRDGLVPL